MDWIDSGRALAEDALVHGAAVLVQPVVEGIVRRVWRGRGPVAAHSETGPPATVPDTEETETPVTTIADRRTGEQLAEELLRGVGNEQMRVATRYLGAHRDGYWLRRFAQDLELTAAADQPLIDRTGTHPWVDWDAVGYLLMTDGSPVSRSSASEAAALEFAASIVGRCAIQLKRIVRALDDADFQRALEALREAAYGDPR